MGNLLSMSCPSQSESDQRSVECYHLT